MKSKILLTLLVVTAFVFQGWSQQRTVSGTVMSADDGQPLIGVNILVSGSSLGTITDIDGSYEISTADDATLVFTYAGFEDQSVLVAGQSVINVVMNEGVQLDEVVVTALGISREKKALGYSVESVSSEDIAKSGKTNILGALQGRVSGVNIQSGSGAPGAGMDIKIRGLNSLDPSRDNSPLIVIDGIQISNSTDVLDVFPSAGPIERFSGQQASNGNRLADINPNDIESMNILKGAAATALYGSRAANGAVIITTKRGKSGEPKISLNTSYGIENVGITPELQTKFRDGRRGAVRFTSTGDHWYFQSQGPKVYDGQPTVIRNFYDDFYETGNSASIGLSISGGTDDATYFISGNTFTQKGIIRSATYDKDNLRFGGDLKVTDKITLRSSIAYTNSGGNKIHEGQKSVLSSLSFMNNSLDLNDYLNDDGSQKNPFLFIIDQPFYLLDVSHNRDDVNRYIGDVGVNYKINDSWSIDYSLGQDSYTDERERFVPPGLDLSSQVNGFIYEQRIKSKITTSLLKVMHHRSLTDDLDMNVVLGHEIFSTERDILNTRGEDFSIPDFAHISNAAQVSASNSISKRNTIGAFAQVEFGYAHYLYLTLSGRNDWSSTLPKENRSYFYPSASLAWVVSDMTTLPSAFSFLKFRASLAKVGKDALPYKDGTVFSQASNFPFGSINGFGQNTSVGNPDLRPEFTTSTEFGIEFGLFDNFANFEATYYNDNSKDLLMNVPVSNATGASRVYTNAGTIENSGIELVANFKPIQGIFYWNTGFNWFKNQGKVLEINNDNGFVTLYDNGGRARGIEARFVGPTVDDEGNDVPGGAVGDIWGHDFLYSPDGDLIVGDNGYPIVDNTNKYLVGNAVPDFIANWNNSIGYKNVELSFLWEWKKGGDVFDMGRRNGIRNGLLKETERRYEQLVVNGVVKQPDGTYLPNTQAIEWDPESVHRNSGRYNDAGTILIEDGSWIRLRNVNIRYKLPSDMLQSVGIAGASISLTGNNLFLDTPFKGYDPETNYFGSGSNILGYTGLKTPGTRSYLATLHLDF